LPWNLSIEEVEKLSSVEVTGLEKEGEKIKLKLAPPTELCWEGARNYESSRGVELI